MAFAVNATDVMTALAMRIDATDTVAAFATMRIG
jgi:hypothetical protein